MDTNIIFHTNSGQTTSAARFAAIYFAGASAFMASQLNGGESIMPCAGTFKNLYINCDAGPGAGITRTFLININGTDTGITLSLTGAGTGAGVSSGSDTAHTVSFNAGDAVSLKTTATGTTTGTGVIRATLAATCAANTSMLLATSGSALSVTDPQYMPVQGVGTDTTANGVEMVMPTAGTLQNAYMSFGATPNAAQTITLFVNGSPTSVVITTNTVSGTDLTHSASVNAGDKVYWQFTQGSNSGPAVRVQISIGFNPTTNGESIHMFASNLSQVNSAVRFLPIPASSNLAYGAAEGAKETLTQAVIWKNLYIYEQTILSAGTYQYQPQYNAVSGSLTVTANTSSQSFNDTIHTDNTNAGDTISLKVTPATTPTAVVVEWGIVSYIAPPSKILVNNLRPHIFSPGLAR